MKNNTKRVLLRALGLVLCVVPVATSVLLYFPLWCSKGGGTVVSGFCVLLLILSFTPLIKHAREIFKSPSGYVLWLTLFVIFLLLSKIAEEMTVISFVGFVGNLLGSLAFKISEKIQDQGVKNEGRF